ncbi:MAG: hypothetical protein ACYDBK_08385 [Thermoplasmataceae archaeon]
MKADEPVVETSEIKQFKSRILEWERILRRKPLKLDLLHEALEVSYEKNGLDGCCPSPRTIPDEVGVTNPEGFPIQFPPEIEETGV